MQRNTSSPQNLTPQVYRSPGLMTPPPTLQPNIPFFHRKNSLTSNINHSKQFHQKHPHQQNFRVFNTTQNLQNNRQASLKKIEVENKERAPNRSHQISFRKSGYISPINEPLQLDRIKSEKSLDVNNKEKSTENILFNSRLNSILMLIGELQMQDKKREYAQLQEELCEVYFDKMAMQDYLNKIEIQH